MQNLLFVAPQLAPFSDDDASVGGAGLCRALADHGFAVKALCLITGEVDPSRFGLARRLRTVNAEVSGERLSLAVFEGRTSTGKHDVLALAHESLSRLAVTPSQRAAVIGTATEDLAQSGFFSPQVVIGWGEETALALGETEASTRFLVLPEGRLGPPLSEEDAQSLGLAPSGGKIRHLVDLGVEAASGVLVPSLWAAARLRAESPALGRLPEERVLPLRLGVDEPPKGPELDPSLPTHYSATALQGKRECRRHLVKEASLALEAKTLLAMLPRPFSEVHGNNLLDGVERLLSLDVAFLLPTVSPEDPFHRRAHLLGVEHPGRLGFVDGHDVGAFRRALAGADVAVFSTPEPTSAREPGLAQLYGTLPVAAAVGAFADRLVDFDPLSATGNALLTDADQDGLLDAAALEAGVRRAVGLRAQPDAWTPLVENLFRSAPRWAGTVSQLRALFSGPSSSQ